MIDILFVEIGAVVTEVLGPSRCTIEPFCDALKTPTYGAAGRVEVDLTRSLVDVLRDRGVITPIAIAARRAVYDQIEGYGGVPLGPSWPGGRYEGTIGIREDVLRSNATLAAAAALLPGRPWEYQVVASIDDETGDVRRYHGFHAEVVKDEGEILLLRVANAGWSMDPNDPAREVRYDPSDTRTFYAGGLVAEHAVRGGRAPRSGAVFIELEAAERFALTIPKLPPGAGR
jgi:hypothetical protein